MFHVHKPSYTALLYVIFISFYFISVFKHIFIYIILQQNNYTCTTYILGL